MEDRTEYRLERLEKEFEKLRIEVKKNPGTLNINLENVQKMVDSVGTWIVTTILLILNIVVDFVALPIKKALVVISIVSMLVLAVKIITIFRERKS